MFVRVINVYQTKIEIDFDILELLHNIYILYLVHVYMHNPIHIGVRIECMQGLVTYQLHGIIIISRIVKNVVSINLETDVFTDIKRSMYISMHCKDH